MGSRALPRRVRATEGEVKIDPELVSFHSFGALVIALHDGRLMALAVIEPPKDTIAVKDFNRSIRDRALARRHGAKMKATITWGTEFQ